jgi:thymidylate synthase (FAD)
MNIKKVGDGKVVLIAGAGKIYTDVAARFCRSERDLENIIATPYDKNIVRNILSAGHLAALEFDYFIFGFSGYSRVFETQLVRKRIASYLIKSGRIDLNGKRAYNVVLPDGILNHKTNFYGIDFTTERILELLEKWYNEGVQKGYPEENLRYLKPQATESKGVTGMNARALLDYFFLRCCKTSQFEHQDFANKALRLCKQAKPDLFESAGAACVKLGYCPQNQYQHPDCKGKIPTHNDVLQILKGKL